jgi:O-antigen/teichoic acid export membrane protein
VAGPAAGYLLKEHSSKQVRLVSYSWSLLISFVITGILFAIKKIGQTEFFLLTALCWLNSANSIHLHLLLAKQKFNWFNSLNLFSPLLTLGILFLLFYKGEPSRINYLIALLIAWSVAFITGWIVSNKGERKEALTSWKNLLKQGFSNGISNQASHLAGLLNNRLVFFLLPATALGVYSNALSLAEATLMIPGSLGQVMYASALQEKKPSTVLYLKKAGWVSAVLLFLAFLVVLFLPEGFYLWIFGPGFSGVSGHLKQLIFCMILYSGYLITSYWQSARGKFLKNFYANLAGLAVNLLLTCFFLLSGNYSIGGGIFALGGSFIAMCLFSFFQVFKSQAAESKAAKAYPAENILDTQNG